MVITRTGHPYLTGLAIAGGVYWLGLQGAVIGPLLLCTLVIVLNLFKALIKTETTNDSVPELFPEKPIHKGKFSKVVYTIMYIAHHP